LSLASQRQELIEQQRASRARYYPKLSINGNYGGLGRSIGGVQGTGIIQGQIDFTVFDRDRSGELQELASRVKRIDDQIADMSRGIEEEIHEALLNLESADEQVAVNSNSRRIVFNRAQRITSKWSLPKTNSPAPSRTTFWPSPATRTRSLRSPGPWGIRKRTLANIWRIRKRFIERAVTYFPARAV
jgi:hypothetical protein